MSDSHSARIDELTIAAFFHDIGKFAQRAGRRDLRSDRAEQLCPLDVRKLHTHEHVLYTDGAVAALRDALPDGVNASSVAALAASHHNPSSDDEWIVAVADRLSSGSDRRKDEEIERETRRKFYETPMESIFANVRLGNAGSGAKSYVRLVPLDPGEELTAAGGAPVDADAYAALWQRFEADLRSIAVRGSEAYLEALDATLERYWWCIPSTTVDQPDISLYDHSRTTAAFAALLWRCRELGLCRVDQGFLHRQGERPFLFVSGDLSGIQRYLFDLRTSKDNAKLLRSRSFVIQALADSIAGELVRQAGLPACCVLQNAGGRFLAAVPNGPDIREGLDRFQLRVEQHFMAEYGGQLTLNLSEGVSAGPADLMQTRFEAFHSACSLDAARAKQRKLQRALSADGHVLRGHYSAIAGSGGRDCPVCALRPASGDSPCPACDRLIALGGDLPKAQRLFVWEGASGAGHIRLFDKRSLSLARDGDRLPDGYSLRRSINQYMAGLGVFRSPYAVPMKDGSVIEFSAMAASGAGAAKLAMFKADLDNLGAVFGPGLGRAGSTSRIVSLSRMLNWFFSTNIDHLIRSDADYRERIYVVYSGGDDLCIIGQWESVLRFAADVHRSFRRFTGGNASLTISAGIALANASTPVRILARAAEEALETAKRRRNSEGRTIKDGVSIFGLCMGWDEYEELLTTGGTLFRHLVDGQLSTGFVHRLLDYGARALELERGRVDARNALWRSKFRYDVARVLSRNDSLRDSLIMMVEQHIKNIRLPVSYALYRRRGGKEE